MLEDRCKTTRGWTGLDDLTDRANLLIKLRMVQLSSKEGTTPWQIVIDRLEVLFSIRIRVLAGVVIFSGNKP